MEEREGGQGGRTKLRMDEGGWKEGECDKYRRIRRVERERGK